MPTKIEDNTLFISFNYNNGFHINSIRRNRQVIELILVKYLNVNLKIECIKDKNIEIKKKETPALNGTDEEMSHDNSCFDTLMEIFDGELIR